MSVWFTSDTHFGHRNILNFCAASRPYENTDAMDENIIATWNSLIPDNHIVHHLGDFSFHKDPDKNLEIFKRLNGKKYLTVGNHDEIDVQDLPWEDVRNYREIKYNKKKIVLFHYPIETWNKSHRGAYHLHGHVHSMKDLPKTFDIANRYDVGWDRNMRPLNLEELLAQFEAPLV